MIFNLTKQGRILAGSCLAVAAMFGLAATPAHASATGTMGVSAQVSGTCTITATPLTFTAIASANGKSVLDDVNTTVNLTCTPGTNATAFEITSGGNDANGVSASYPFALNNGTHFLAYGLDVQDANFAAAHAVVPTDSTFGTAGTNNVIAGAAAAAITAAEAAGGASYTISGEIPANEAIYVGAYNDTVNLSVTY